MGDVKDQVEITQEKDEEHGDSVEDELEESIQDDFNEEDDENLIHASCTLKRDNTVSISSNVVNIAHNSDNKEEVTEESYPDNTKDITNQEELNREESEGEQDRRKNKLRTPPRPPRKSVSLETKIRDRQLLDSMFGDSKTTENVQVNEDERKEKKEKPPILKQNKSTIALASLNENAKKQSYRIKFKVKLNDKTSKESSVMRYLFRLCLI